MTTQQMKKANGILMLASTIALVFYFIGVMQLYANAAYAGVNPTLVLANAALIVAGIILYVIVFITKRTTKVFLYTVAISYTFIYAFGFLASHSNATFPYIIPILMVFLIFGDSKVINTVAVVQLGLNLIMAITTITMAPAFEAVLESVSIEIIVSVLTCICSIGANRLMNRFNKEAQDEIQDNANRIKDMSEEVVDRAKKTLVDLEGTQQDLENIYETTNIINDVLNDIANSTSATAEAVDSQTRMTASIQDVIQETYQKTTDIVSITEETSDVLDEGVSIVDKLNDTAESSLNAGNEMKVAAEQLQHYRYYFEYFQSDQLISIKCFY